MSASPEIPADIDGLAVESAEGTGLGRIAGQYLDSAGRPKAAVVSLENQAPDAIVPLEDASFENGRVRIRYSEETVRTAPRIAIPARLRDDALKSVDNHFRASATPPVGIPPIHPTLLGPKPRGPLADVIDRGEALTLRSARKAGA